VCTCSCVAGAATVTQGQGRTMEEQLPPPPDRIFRMAGHKFPSPGWVESSSQFSITDTSICQGKVVSCPE